MDLLLLVWDVIAQSAFMRWFLLGALIGLVIALILLAIGTGIGFWESLGVMLICGLAAVVVRLAYWLGQRNR